MKQRIRMITDLAMIILMPLLMAYALVGETLHEWLGVIIFLLFILHHVLNLHWITSIAKGKYNAARTINLIVNLALVLVMFLLPFSGIMMSRHVFTFLNMGAFIATARVIHLVTSYWGYILMCFHLGLHLNAMKSYFSKRRKIKVVWKSVALKVLIGAIFVYGIYAFIKRDFSTYLFLKTQFVFFDYEQPILFFLIDYVAVMILFAGTGYYILKFFQRNKNNQQ